MITFFIPLVPVSTRRLYTLESILDIIGILLYLLIQRQAVQHYTEIALHMHCTAQC